MKKLNVLLLINLMLISSSFTNAEAKPEDHINGIWLGAMKVSEKMELRFGFVISMDENGDLTASMNVIEQKAFDIKMDLVTYIDGKINIKLTEAGITYAGVYDKNNDLFTGTYKQGDASFELNLKRVDELPGEVVRTQTPVRPFPYMEEEVVFENVNAGIKLAGTLTIPETGKKSPAIILIPGSGHTNRDETPMGHFFLLADYLTRNGYAVLRFDKRGVGESTGDYDAATTFDFAEDVKAAVTFLMTRENIDNDRIGLIGHSEGALIAPMVATDMDIISFIIMMGGSGVNGGEIRLQQTEKISKVNGVPDSLIMRELDLIKSYHRVISSETENESKFKMIKSINSDLSDGLIEYYLKPWYKCFIEIEPDYYLKKVVCPVLAITGENDLQCPPEINLPAIESALKTGGNSDYTVQTIPGLNHLFQTSKSGSPSEYESIAEIISPQALDLLNDWLKTKIK